VKRKYNLRVVSRAELEALPTKALLGRLKRLYECEQEPADSDLDPGELAALEALGGINFKSEPQWRAAFKDVKAVLATREPVQPPAERQAEPRQERHGRRDR
jgi:hypothetical protein